MSSFWRYEKLYQYTHKQLRNIWMTAEISRKRCYVWGSLATLAWICGVSQMEPPQKTGQILPHLAMIVIASTISKTTTDNLKKANETQKQAKILLKGLRCARDQESIDKIHTAVQNLQRRYPVIHDYGKE